MTGYGKLVLAEFDYDGKPCESFPFDQSRERYSMWALKAYGLPESPGTACCAAACSARFNVFQDLARTGPDP